MNLKNSDFLKRHAISFCFTGFVLGLLGEKVFYFGNNLYIFLLLFIALSLIFFLRKTPNFNSLVFLFLIAGVFFIFSQIAYKNALPEESPIIQSKMGQNIKIKGEVLNFPTESGDKQRFYIKSGEHKLLVYIPLYPKVFYGDVLTLTGKIEKPETFETNSGRVFDYPGYLSKDGVGFVMRSNKFEIINNSGGNIFVKTLFKLKRSWIDKIEEIFPGREGALLSGVLLGQKALDDETEESFRIVGLSHIVVLSGYNIAVVILAMKNLFSRVGKRKKIIISAIFAILFTVMVSSGASTVRATFMALSVMFADMFSRKVTPQRALFIAVFFMILINPLIVFYDPGFLLSFLATFGIIHFSNFIKDKLVFLGSKSSLKEIISTSFSAQIFVLPYIIYLSGLVPVASPLTNILVLPSLPLLMSFGALAVSVSFLLKILALPFVLGSKIILIYILKIVDIFSSFETLSLAVPPVSLVFIILIYILMIGATLIWYEKRARDKTRALFITFQNIGFKGDFRNF